MRGHTAHPLSWPHGQARAKRPARARFDCTFVQARSQLLNEVMRLDARHAVLSTNEVMRLDGLPYSNRTEPDDAGVALYFEYKGKAMAFACDRWDRVKDNIRAIAKTIEAMRGIERWGAGDMVARAFSGFEALPPPGSDSGAPASTNVEPELSWRDVLGLDGTCFDPPGAIREQLVHDVYKSRAKSAHPDAPGGSNEAMAQLNKARDEALQAIKESRA